MLIAVISARGDLMRTQFIVRNPTLHPPTTEMTNIFPSIKGNGSIFPVCDTVLSHSIPISKRMLVLLRHVRTIGERDGAVRWDTLMHHVQGHRAQIGSWTCDDWQEILMNGTDEHRCGDCLDQHGRIRYMRSIQGHSEGRSTAGGGLPAGGVATQGRRASSQL